MGDRNIKTWNVAADYAINENLLRTGFTLPDNELDMKAYHDMPTEEIYTILKQTEQPGDDPGNQSGEGEGQSGGGSGQGESDGEGGGDGDSTGDNENDDQQGDSDAKNESDDPGGCGAVVESDQKENPKELESTWKSAVAQAAQLSKGNLPGELQLQIDEYLNPHVPWHVLLRDFVEKTPNNQFGVFPV